jgi:hypothetical protein
MNRVYDFLGLRRIEVPLGYHFMGDYKGFPDVTEAQMQRLKDTYREPNEELFELLGRRISTWL